MAASTRSRVVFEIGRFPVMTYETVLCDTPATRATSLLVNATTPAPLLSIRIVDAHRHASAPLRRPQDPRRRCCRRKAPAGAPSRWATPGVTFLIPAVL